MITKVILGVALAGSMAIAPLAMGVFQTQNTAAACSCCGSQCACEVCVCDDNGCECNASGDCACTADCCATCCAE